MKQYYRTKEHSVMKLELDSYRGNLVLVTYYVELMKGCLTENIASYCLEDLKRAEANIKEINDLIAEMPVEEREFLTDVFIDMLPLQNIYDKYNLSKSAYFRYLDKSIYLLARLKNESYFK